MNAIPPEAITAATDDIVRGIIAQAQREATAAERERIIALAEHHNIRIDMGPLSDPPNVPFAGYLRTTEGTTP
jgi:hypothetical protein